MSAAENVIEAMRRSLQYLPITSREAVKQMLSYGSLAIITATVIAWGSMHLFGLGEIVDAILLGIGALTIGLSVFDGARELLAFAKNAITAHTDADLDRAAHHFANAITILGISVVQSILLRGQAKTVINRGLPKLQPRFEIGDPPADGSRLQLTRPPSLPEGSLGITDEYGTIQISRSQSLSEQRITLYHELVHRYFSPRTGPLRQLRAEANISGYNKSVLLRYLEEALAEGYAQMRENGLAEGLQQYRFPILNGYVTISQIASEGQSIGTIALGGMQLYVTITFQDSGNR